MVANVSVATAGAANRLRIEPPQYVISSSLNGAGPSASLFNLGRRRQAYRRLRSLSRGLDVADPIRSGAPGTRRFGCFAPRSVLGFETDQILGDLPRPADQRLEGLEGFRFIAGLPRVLHANKMPIVPPNRAQERHDVVDGAPAHSCWKATARLGGSLLELAASVDEQRGGGSHRRSGLEVGRS
jgi:hypothetical protein